MKPPILRDKRTNASSVFRPENLLREARRQRDLPAVTVPALCVLDPDGDLVDHLVNTAAAAPLHGWACYHSILHTVDRPARPVGIVGRAVGAPYAVLVAEQLFASGCRLVVNITSSGQLRALGSTPYFVLVERALRDEGTSYHYLDPGDFADADPALIDAVAAALAGAGPRIVRAATWTTDAPFRETAHLLAEGAARGLAAIEMECAALYALARARGLPVACFAHVTNTLAVVEGDFEKGAARGAIDALAIVDAIALHLDAILMAAGDYSAAAATAPPWTSAS